MWSTKWKSNTITMDLPVRNQFYTFVAAAEPGSDNSLVAEGRRLYTHAQFLGPQGGDYAFSFNGMELYVYPSGIQFANDDDLISSTKLISDWNKEKQRGGTRRMRSIRRKVRAYRSRKASRPSTRRFLRR